MWNKVAEGVRKERGFTLIEILSTLVILSVIGTAVLNVTGKSNLLLGRQSHEMDIRYSARAVLTRMVNDIQNAQATNVTANGTQVQIWNQGTDLTKNPPPDKTYVFDQTNQQVYLLDANGNKTFLIKAINMAVFSPPDKNNEVKMQITVTVGTSKLTLEDVAMVRSVQFNSSPMPQIKAVTPSQIIFNGHEKEEHQVNGKFEDDDESDDDVNGNGVQTVHIYAIDTHYAQNTIIQIVSSDQTVVHQYFNPGNSNQTVRVYNSDPNSGYSQELAFEINKNDLPDGTYTVKTITPNYYQGKYDEIAIKINALVIGSGDSENNNNNDNNQDSPPPDVNKHDPNNDTWDSNDWVINHGAINGFGSIDTSAKTIEKKVNANAKIAYYNHLVQGFDYHAQIEVENAKNSSKSNPKAMLALLYDNNSNWYYGLGIGSDGYVYIGPVTDKADNSAILTVGGNKVYVGNEATLRAVYYQNTTTNQWNLDIYVNGIKKSTIIQIPWPNNTAEASGYLGVSVTDNGLQAGFDLSN